MSDVLHKRVDLSGLLKEVQEASEAAARKLRTPDRSFTGAEPKILFNRARCRKCGTFLESKNEHDLQTCACGAISIDGGRKYIRQIAKDLNDIEDLTEYAK